VFPGEGPRLQIFESVLDGLLPHHLTEGHTWVVHSGEHLPKSFPGVFEQWARVDDVVACLKRGGRESEECLQGHWKKDAGLFWYFHTHHLKYSPVRAWLVHTWVSQDIRECVMVLNHLAGFRWTKVDECRFPLKG